MYHFIPLKAVAIAVGTAIIATRLPGVLKPQAYRDWLRKFPRSVWPGIVFLSIALAWCVTIVTSAREDGMAVPKWLVMFFLYAVYFGMILTDSTENNKRGATGWPSILKIWPGLAAGVAALLTIPIIRFHGFLPTCSAIVVLLALMLFSPHESLLRSCSSVALIVFGYGVCTINLWNAEYTANLIPLLPDLGNKLLIIALFWYWGWRVLLFALSRSQSDFLTVRGLSILLLMLAKVVVDSANQLETPWRLVMTVIAYVW
ncbi:MAG: hypothetical protein NTY01_04910, partial [Verrucomicrobia bacterium]|nr:hypothetical protein [Verrucomicrobiota bacterium]